MAELLGLLQEGLLLRLAFDSFDQALALSRQTLLDLDQIGFIFGFAHVSSPDRS